MKCVTCGWKGRACDLAGPDDDDMAPADRCPECLGMVVDDEPADEPPLPWVAGD